AGGGEVQDVALSDGSLLWQHVAGLVREWGEDLIGDGGLSAVGAVVGATFPREVAEARRLLPQSVFLLPGVGAQGGRPADVAAALLLVVTIAVLAVHYTAQRHSTVRVAKAVHVVRAPARRHHAVPLARYVVVQRGDSFYAIAARTHVGVSVLERLNPGAGSTT